MDDKQLLMRLYEAVVGKRWDEVRDLLHPDFVDHSPAVAPMPGPDGGREAFVAYFQGGDTPLDGATVEIQRMLADGGLVMVHYRLLDRRHVRGLAVVDLFRLRDGRFVEHWDVLQPVPEDAPNPRAMF